MPLRLALALSIAGLLALAPATLAQDEPEAPPEQQPGETFEPSHLAAAQRIVELTRSDAPFDDILPNMATRTRQTFVQASPALAREIEETVMEVAIEMAADRARLARVMQLIWARRFTEEELRQLDEFFSSPVGSKFADQTPVITALTLGAARQWEAALADEMVNRTRQALQEKGLL